MRVSFCGWRLRAMLLFAGVMATCVMALLLFVVRPPVPKLASGSTPDNFMFLMFPSRPDVPVFDKPNGQQVGTLTRAMANSHEEMTASGDWVARRDSDGIGWVKKSDLTSSIPDSEFGPYFQEFAKQYTSRANAQRAEFEFEPVEGGTEATLTLRDTDEIRTFHYVVRNGVPQAILTETDVRHALQAERMVRWMLCAASGVVAYFGAWLLVSWRRRRLDAKAMPDATN